MTELFLSRENLKTEKVLLATSLLCSGLSTERSWWLLDRVPTQEVSAPLCTAGRGDSHSGSAGHPARRLMSGWHGAQRAWEALAGHLCGDPTDSASDC